MAESGPLSLYLLYMVHTSSMWSPWKAAILPAYTFPQPSMQSKVRYKEALRKQILQWPHFSISHWKIKRLYKMWPHSLFSLPSALISALTHPPTLCLNSLISLAYAIHVLNPLFLEAAPFVCGLHSSLCSNVTLLKRLFWSSDIIMCSPHSTPWTTYACY